MNNTINDNNISTAEVNARYFYDNGNNKTAEEKAKEDAELIKQMNIPSRDEENYPMPNEEEIKKAGTFLWKLNLLASSYDKNMQALIWDLYISMNNFIDASTEDIDNEKAKGLKVLVDLNRLKLYIKESDNPIFKNNPK